MRRTSHLTNRDVAEVYGNTNEIHAARAKVWVKQPDSPPIFAGVVAQEKDNTILTDDPGQEWQYVLLTHIAMLMNRLFLEA